MRWVWRFIRYLTGNCEVCRGRQQVKMRRPGRSVGSVMPCPHCTSAVELELFVSAIENQGAPVGGDAA